MKLPNIENRKYEVRSISPMARGIISFGKLIDAALMSQAT
jgi:hypothetical protein